MIACLQRFYESETTSLKIEQWGKAENLKISTDENFAQTEQFIAKPFCSLALETIR